MATCSSLTSAQTPVSGRIWSSPQIGVQLESWGSRCMGFSWSSSGNDGDDRALALFRRGGPDLAALGHEHHVVVGRVAVDEMTEALARLGVVDRLGPFVGIGVDHALHVGLQVGGDL